MGNDIYTSVPLDDGPEGYALGAANKRQMSSRLETVKRVAFISILAVVVFLLGFGAGDRYGKAAKSTATATVSVGEQEAAVTGGESGSGGALLPPQAFVPDCELTS